MSKDIKLEILYYKNSADVSLEFGLHGDYPLRLLSVTNNSIKEFLHNLKRALSRSEIIIVVGELDGTDRLTHYLARSIGRDVELHDNGDHGILEMGTVTLPDESIPLVTKGKYCGYLIESGPQAIFALNNYRALRSKIIDEVIVGYITEHHKIYGLGILPVASTESTDIREVAVAVDSPITEEKLPIAPLEFTDISSSSVNSEESTNDSTVENENTDNVDELGITVDSGITANLDEQEVFLTENNTVSNETQDASLNAVEIDTTNDINVSIPVSAPILAEPIAPIAPSFSREAKKLTFQTCETTKIKTVRTGNTYPQTKIIRLICIVLSLLVLLSSIAFVILKKKNIIPDNATYYSSLAAKFYNLKDKPSEAFRAVKAENQAFFTWLRFDSANVDHPVLSVSNDSNGKKYLTKLPNGRSYSSGSLYSTSKSLPTASEQNIVIFGNAKDDGIFEKFNFITSNAKDFKDYIIQTADNRYQENWRIVSVFTESKANSFDYTKTDFADINKYVEYLDTLKELSFFNTKREFIGVEVLLILVGVDGDEKHVIVAMLDSVNIYSDSQQSAAVVPDGLSSTPQYDSDADVKFENNIYSDDHDGTDTPVITLPSVDTVKPDNDSDTSSKTSSTVSSNPQSSSTTSSKVSSTILSSNSSKVSSTVSSKVSSTVPSKPSSISSKVSSSSSKVSSSKISSSNSDNNKPQIDPIYTWDLDFTITDSATGIKYTTDAVTMVAMIIEDEMSPTIDPPEALIAQAIVKYNWLLNNNGGKNALDPNPTKQAIKYANEAKGSLITYKGTVAKTYCFAYSAGKTANYQDIWGGGPYAYLVSVDCAVDEKLSNFATTTTYSSETMRKVIKNVCDIDVSGMNKSEWLVPTQYDSNNLYCTKIKIGGEEFKGTYLRNNLLTKANTGVSTIRSSAYTISYDEKTDTFSVTCKGYGHGVGLSQAGAKAYAKMGWTHEQIIAHFFPGTTLVKH